MGLVLACSLYMFGNDEVKIEKTKLDPIIQATGEYLYWYFAQNKNLSQDAVEEIIRNAAQDFVNDEVTPEVFMSVCSDLAHTLTQSPLGWPVELQDVVERATSLDPSSTEAVQDIRNHIEQLLER